MKTENNTTIYTIGHSVHDIDTFVNLLQSFNIKLLADIRSNPGSKRHQQFNKPALAASLKQVNIRYEHIPALGGKLGSAYNSYNDYMQTDAFSSAVVQLQNIALQQPTVYMCAEADWRHCHRAKVSAYLATMGWDVVHITAAGIAQPHYDLLKQAALF